MCVWEQDVARWRHSLHARPVHLQRTCNPFRLVAIMHIEQGEEAIIMAFGVMECEFHGKILKD